MASSTPPRQRILCLHGKGGDGSRFVDKVCAALHLDRDTTDLIAPTAPHTNQEGECTRVRK